MMYIAETGRRSMGFFREVRTFVAKVLTDQDHYGLRDSTAGNTASIMIVTVMLLLASAASPFSTGPQDQKHCECQTL